MLTLSSVEPQISHFVNFTLCEEMVPIRHFWQMCNFCTVNFDNFWGVKSVLKFHIFVVFNVWRTSTMWRIGTKFSQMWRIGTKSSHVWRIGTKSSHLWKHWYKITKCKKMVSKFTRVKNWYKILTYVKKRYQIITHNKNWYLIVTYVSDKTVKNWNRMQNAADLGEFLSMWRIRIHAIWNLTWCLFSQSVRYWYEMVTYWYQFFTVCDDMVPILYSVKFTKCEICGSTEHTEPDFATKLWLYQNYTTWIRRLHKTCADPEYSVRGSWQRFSFISVFHRGTYNYFLRGVRTSISIGNL